MKKLLVAIIVVAGLGFLGWQIYQKASASRPEGARRRPDVPVAVAVAAVERAPIRDIGRFSGSLHALAEFIVAPKISGRLEKILVDIGDTVTGGQLMAVLDDEEYRQQASQVTAELEVAQATLEERRSILENARREYDRTVVLRQKKIASESQLDAAESEFKTQQAKVKVAVAQVAQKKAALETARVRLAYARIRVPANGNNGENRVVGERFVDEGAMLAPNTPMASILDISSLVAVISVIERDYSKLKPGLAAAISTDAHPGLRFSGRVVRVAPILKQTTREARVEIEIPNHDLLLKPGMFVRVQIEFARHENACVVPLSALVKRDGVEVVFRADTEARSVRRIPVTVGIRNGGQAEILDPPLTGSVVVLGHHLLEDGSRIIVPSAEGASDRSPKSADTDVKTIKIPASGQGVP